MAIMKRLLRSTGMGLLVSVFAASVFASDEWEAMNPDDDTSNTRNVLIAGDPAQRHDLQAISSVADQDWYRLVIVPGHSYELRVSAGRDFCFDLFGSDFQVFETDGTTLVSTGIDYPGGGGFSAYRNTFTVPTSGAASSSPYLLRLTGGTTCTSASDYTIQFFDTTLVNPLWSTFGGFETFYRFQNVTNATINVRLRLINDANATVADVTFPILAGRTVATRNTGPGDLNVADNNAGQALITHNGPAGGIQVDGFLGIFSGGQTIVLPIKVQRGWKGD